ncbi:MAG: hypothetical protein KGI97_05865, partial [Alphaproteobacteria bacterium]|nr:hypothetical protein [Alphaproteobacteria bacterium]
VAAPVHAQLVIGHVSARPSRNPAEKKGTYIVHVPVLGIKADDVLLAVKYPGARIDIIDNRAMLKGGAEHYIAIDHLPLQKIQAIAAPNDNYLILRLISLKTSEKPKGRMSLEFVYQKAGVKTVDLPVYKASSYDPNTPTYWGIHGPKINAPLPTHLSAHKASSIAPAPPASQGIKDTQTNTPPVVQQPHHWWSHAMGILLRLYHHILELLSKK